jgi:cation transport ATPase
MDMSRPMTSDRQAEIEPGRAVVTWSGGEVRLRDPRVFGVGVTDPALCARFLGRVLTLGEVLGVTVDRAEATAIIRLTPGAGAGDTSEFFARLAGAIRGEGSGSGSGWAIPAARWARGTRFSVHRHGGLYSMWGVVYDRPGRLRLRHEALSLNPLLGHRLAREIAAHASGARASASAWTGSLAIDYDPATFSTAELIRLAEESLESWRAGDMNWRAGGGSPLSPKTSPLYSGGIEGGSGSERPGGWNPLRLPLSTGGEEDRGPTPPARQGPIQDRGLTPPARQGPIQDRGLTPPARQNPPPARQETAEVSLTERSATAYGSQNLELAGATLGIAALGQFAVPALVPVSAVLLVGTNLRTFQAAWHQARARQFGLPALSTTIVATTMISSQFVGAALMSCCTAYWNRRARRDLDDQRRHLLEDCLPTVPLVRLLDGPEGAPEVLVPPDQIHEGNRIVVVAGEAIPADGKILDGGLVVDERGLRGLDGASRKGPGDPVLAGSTVLAGSAKVKVERTGDATRGALIARALTSATSPARGRSAPTRHAETFASRTVGPVLATSGFGFLLSGNPVTALAMMRPDYATGVGVSVPLATLRDVATCARRGIVIRDPDAFDKLDRVDVVLLDDHPALGRTALEVAGIETRMPSEVEPDLLRYAASALRHLDDPRAPALAAACRDRQVPLFDLEPAELAERGVGVSIAHGRRRIRVYEADPDIERALEDARGVGPTLLSDKGSVGPTLLSDKGSVGPTLLSDKGSVGPTLLSDISGGTRPLLVEINGNVVALISFRASDTLEGAEAVRRLAASRRVPIVLLTDRTRAEAASTAAALGVNQVKGSLDPQARRDIVRSYRLQGLKAAFVGDCSDPAIASAAAEAYVAISIPRARPAPFKKGKGKRSRQPRTSDRSVGPTKMPVPDHDEAFLSTDYGPASVLLLSDRLDRLDQLWEIAGGRARRIRRDQAIITVPNVFSAAGALLFGFTSFHTILLTNMGTYTAYNLAKGPPERRGIHEIQTKIEPPSRQGRQDRTGERKKEKPINHS